jgi:hypothetical protein
MTQPKKRPNKAAKAAQKILEASKLLAANKVSSEAKSDQAFQLTESAVKPAPANKKRPNKKRG